MPRWSDRLRRSLPFRSRRDWVEPGNAITRAIEREARSELPPHLPSEPDPVPAPVTPPAPADDRADRPGSGQPPSAA